MTCKSCLHLGNSYETNRQYHDADSKSQNRDIPMIVDKNFFHSTSKGAVAVRSRWKLNRENKGTGTDTSWLKPTVID